MAAFNIENGKVAPNETLEAGLAAEFVTLWDKADAIQKLMPKPERIAESTKYLIQIRDALNAAAAGGDLAVAEAQLKETETAIRENHASIRKNILRSDWCEIVVTVALSLAILGLYALLHQLGFSNVEDNDLAYQLNVYQNLIGATGWALLGFTMGLIIRRVHELKTAKFDSLVARLAKNVGQTDPLWRAGGNLLVVGAAFLSVYLGVAFVSDSGLGWPNIELPRSSVLPGVLLGIVTPKLVKALLG